LEISRTGPGTKFPAVFLKNLIIYFFVDIENLAIFLGGNSNRFQGEKNCNSNFATIGPINYLINLTKFDHIRVFNSIFN
jgi:hypothetical protein